MQPRHPFPSLAILSSFLSVITNWWVYECSLDVTCPAVCNAIIITSPALSRPVVRTQVLHVQYSTVQYTTIIEYSIASIRHHPHIYYTRLHAYTFYTSTRLHICTLHLHIYTKLQYTNTPTHPLLHPRRLSRHVSYCSPQNSQQTEH